MISAIFSGQRYCFFEFKKIFLQTLYPGQTHYKNVYLSENQSRKRDGNAAQNFSLINRIALNLLKNEPSKKRSVKGKRLTAGWNNDYLLKILKN